MERGKKEFLVTFQAVSHKKEKYFSIVITKDLDTMVKNGNMSTVVTFRYYLQCFAQKPLFSLSLFPPREKIPVVGFLRLA